MGIIVFEDADERFEQTGANIGPVAPHSDQAAERRYPRLRRRERGELVRVSKEDLAQQGGVTRIVLGATRNKRLPKTVQHHWVHRHEHKAFAGSDHFHQRALRSLDGNHDLPLRMLLVDSIQPRPKRLGCRADLAVPATTNYTDLIGAGQRTGAVRSGGTDLPGDGRQAATWGGLLSVAGWCDAPNFEAVAGPAARPNTGRKMPRKPVSSGLRQKNRGEAYFV